MEVTPSFLKALEEFVKGVSQVVCTYNEQGTCYLCSRLRILEEEIEKLLESSRNS
jgi:hypothetical protein